MTDELDDDYEKVKCNACGFVGTLDDFDVSGSCPDNLFCNQCNTEINAATGYPSLLCGKCSWCESLMVDGEFDETQKARRWQIAKATEATQ